MLIHGHIVLLLDIIGLIWKILASLTNLHPAKFNTFRFLQQNAKFLIAPSVINWKNQKGYILLISSYKYYVCLVVKVKVSWFKGQRFELHMSCV